MDRKNFTLHAPGLLGIWVSQTVEVPASPNHEKRPGFLEVRGQEKFGTVLVGGFSTIDVQGLHILVFGLRKW